MALISVHTELREPEAKADPDRRTAIVRTLTLLFGDLGALLTAYRHALERPSQTSIALGDVTF